MDGGATEGPSEREVRRTEASVLAKGHGRPRSLPQGDDPFRAAPESGRHATRRPCRSARGPPASHPGERHHQAVVGHLHARRERLARRRVVELVPQVHENRALGLHARGHGERLLQ